MSILCFKHDIYYDKFCPFCNPELIPPDPGPDHEDGPEFEGYYSRIDVPYRIEDQQVEAIRQVGRMINTSCHEAGWYRDLATDLPMKRNIGEVLMLMVTELAEAYEGWRKGKMDDHLKHRKNMEVELADTIIRILDTAHEEGLDVAGAMQEKFAYNQVRADHKVENRRKPGGKKT